MLPNLEIQMTYVEVSAIKTQDEDTALTGA